MPRIARSALVPHTAAEMYELVRDIESYPDFLPWCSDASVREQSDTHQVASVSIAKSLKQSRFTTRNRLVPGRSIHVSLVDGPFRRLEGSWTFSDVGDAGCRAELVVEFTFASRMFATVMGPAFSRVCNSLVDAFLKRAEVLYGAGRPPPVRS